MTNLETKANKGFVTEDNMAMLTDLYQLTMDASYQQHKKTDNATFDLFVRKLPENRHYMIAAGLEQALQYLENMHFTEDDVEYLRSQELFPEEFLAKLRDFKFTGEVYAVKEGTPVFPNEPILQITGPKMEVQLVETYLLNAMNFQTMVASKASRVVEAAGGRAVAEFGLRRAHGADAGLKGSRACYIAGCASTSNVLAGKEFGIPISGTMAHAYVMSFENETDAFRAYAETFGDKSVFLIDTYDTIEGAKKAALVAKEMEANGKKLKGVRLDSGNLTDLSRKVRQILDSDGLSYVKIMASDDLNEYKIREMLLNGAKIDGFGVGTEMITSKDAPAISGVYKLNEDTLEGKLVPKMKMSEGKDTLPGRKQVYRIYDANGKMVKDVIALEGEEVQGEALLQKVMEDGKLCRPLPSLSETRAYCIEQVARIPAEVRRDNQYAHMKLADLSYGWKDMDVLAERNVPYKVEVSKGLQTLIEDLKEKHRRTN
ncbi:MAG: nicotinate phosphoribosyltransferase [Nanoarchaeota archaeon]|nr:nicotinate phosphoribosyltransferase [Nanoarchaeota archaeon]